MSKSNSQRIKERVWTKSELADAYGITVRTLMTKFRDVGVSTGGRNQILSPKQTQEFFQEFGPPPHIQNFFQNY